uniref:Uncharacterized protein n=1 Tax=Salix viminalis TaxID=40686 RepID=A0A6N2NFZ9_SALVM
MVIGFGNETVCFGVTSLLRNLHNRSLQHERFVVGIFSTRYRFSQGNQNGTRAGILICLEHCMASNVIIINTHNRAVPHMHKKRKKK